MTIGSNQITYRYAAKGDRGPLTVFWYDNGLKPAVPLEVDPDDPAAAPRRRRRWSPAGRRQGADYVRRLVGDAAPAADGAAPLNTRPAKTLPRVTGHHADWLQACKGGTPACSNFDYGARLTEFVLLGALALRTGKVLKWDAEGMKAANVPAAQALIDGTYRKGWELAV